MGNCYSTENNQDIETSLTTTPKTLSKQRANAGMGITGETPGEVDVGAPVIDATGFENQVAEIVKEVQGRLHRFVQSAVQTSNSKYFSQVVVDIINGQGSLYDFAAQVRDPAVSFSSLGYRESQTLEDGGLYEGQWNEQADCPEGAGVKILPDCSLYEGFFYQGQFHGHGRFIGTAEKEMYSGSWVAGLRSGHGVALSEEGTFYTGGWSNDLRHGYGTEKWTDGAVYQGHYLEGKKVGRGVFRWTDGSTYEGHFADNMIQGFGEYMWADGRVYKGQWKENKMEGEGLFLWEDGRKYDGQYLDDKKHGHGKFSWPDGRLYDGQWYDGRQHGVGTYTTADGRTKKGEWAEGKRVKWLDGANNSIGGDSRYSRV